MAVAECTRSIRAEAERERETAWKKKCVVDVVDADDDVSVCSTAFDIRSICSCVCGACVVVAAAASVVLRGGDTTRF